MDNYYRKYFILKSNVDRGRSAILKTEKKNGFIKIDLSYEGKEVRDNLYLLGFDASQKNVLKVKTAQTFDVKSSNFEKTKFLAIVLEKNNACNLAYLEKKNAKTILSAFEKYRFYTFSNVSGKRKKNQFNASKTVETSRVFEKSSAFEVNGQKPSNPSNNKPLNENMRSGRESESSAKSQMSTDNMPNLFSSFQQASKLFSTMNTINPKASPEAKPSNQTHQDQPKTQKINPFMSYFPNSEWVKTQYQGQRGYWHYLSGKIYDGQILKYKAIAVPGEYAVTPPSWLEGFNKYYTSNIPTASGYWIMFLDPDTGKTVDPPS